MNIKEIENFFKEVDKIYKKIPKKEKTFLEISGYPHFENVSSNILSFYLDSKEEHGFNELIIKALINAYKNKQDLGKIRLDISNLDVIREYSTLKGNRIDLVLQNDNFVIGIENKIYADLYNDLEDYEKTINNINNNSIKIVLSLYNKNTGESNNFVNITYSEFFKEIIKELEKNNIEKNKWYMYLIEFINTYENMEDSIEMDSEINNWINKNDKEIKEFLEILENYKKGLNTKINEYRIELDKKLNLKNSSKVWNDDPLQQTAYILLNKYKINIDANLSSKGWRIGLFAWTNKIKNDITNIINENNLKIETYEDKHFFLDIMDFNTPVEDVVEKVYYLYNIVKEYYND